MIRRRKILATFATSTPAPNRAFRRRIRRPMPPSRRHMAAGQAADQANQNATTASNRVTSLAGTVENLDNYKSVSDTTVLFAFDKSSLLARTSRHLMSLPRSSRARSTTSCRSRATPTRPVMLTTTTSSARSRADAVIQYLAQKYQRSCAQDLPDRLGQGQSGGAEHQRLRPRQEPSCRRSTDGEQPDRVGDRFSDRPDAATGATAVSFLTLSSARSHGQNRAIGKKAAHDEWTAFFILPCATSDTLTRSVERETD